jgi:carboxypeptidase PM20D1
MLYTIRGKNESLDAYLLAAHYDVVPVDEDEWTHKPFEAHIVDNFIYGRGMLDDKSSMIAQLEAVTAFLKHHGQPTRTLYLAFGHDEELSGEQGARLMAKHLGDLKLEYVLDEGTLIVEDIFPGLDRAVALIGIADKGYLTVKFSMNTTGGHSSFPDDSHSAIYALSQAIVK